MTARGPAPAPVNHDARSVGKAARARLRHRFSIAHQSREDRDTTADHRDERRPGAFGLAHGLLSGPIGPSDALSGSRRLRMDPPLSGLRLDRPLLAPGAGESRNPPGEVRRHVPRWPRPAPCAANNCLAMTYGAAMSTSPRLRPPNGAFADTGSTHPMHVDPLCAQIRGWPVLASPRPAVIVMGSAIASAGGRPTRVSAAFPPLPRGLRCPPLAPITHAVPTETHP